MGDIPIYLKNTLRSLRTKLGYTQEEASNLLGITARTLRAWEKDSSNIPYAKIKNIEEAYNTSQNYIFFGKEDSFSEQARNKIIC